MLFNYLKILEQLINYTMIGPKTTHTAMQWGVYMWVKLILSLLRFYFHSGANHILQLSHWWDNSSESSALQVTFSLFNFNFRSKFHFLAMRNNDIFNLSIFNPFSATVWLLILAIIVVYSFVLKIISRVEYSQIKLHTEVTFLMILGAFCQQGNKLKFNLMAGRYSLLSLFLCGVLIHNFYTSVLIATLIQSMPETHINSLTDLANSKLSVGFFNNAYHKKFLEVISVI